jgi:hypothetical protein
VCMCLSLCLSGCVCVLSLMLTGVCARIRAVCVFKNGRHDGVANIF